MYVWFGVINGKAFPVCHLGCDWLEPSGTPLPQRVLYSCHLGNQQQLGQVLGLACVLRRLEPASVLQENEM